MTDFLKPRWVNIPPDPPEDPPPPVPGFIPEGEYILEVEHIEERRSQWGNEYYSLRCKVIHPSVHEDFRLYIVLSTTARAMWKMGEFIEAVTGVRPLGQFLFRPMEFLGARLKAHVKYSNFNGVTRNEIGRLSFVGDQ